MRVGKADLTLSWKCSNLKRNNKNQKSSLLSFIVQILICCSMWFQMVATSSACPPHSSNPARIFRDFEYFLDSNFDISGWTEGFIDKKLRVALYRLQQKKLFLLSKSQAQPGRTFSQRGNLSFTQPCRGPYLNDVRKIFGFFDPPSFIRISRNL